jgi:hypothetical protein
LEATGATIKGYMPENGFLVQATPAQVAAIGMLAHVAYVGEFVPEYKRAAKVRAKLARVKAAQESDVASAYRVLLMFRRRSGGGRRENRGVDRRAGRRGRGRADPGGFDGGADRRNRSLGRGAVGGSLCSPAAAQRRGGAHEHDERVQRLDEPGADRNEPDHCRVRHGIVHGEHQHVAPRFFQPARVGAGVGPHRRLERSQQPRDARGRFRIGQRIDVHRQIQRCFLSARLVFQSVQDSAGSLGGLPDNLNDLFRAAFTNGARIHSDSWGAENAGYYDTDCRNLDMFVWSNRTMLIVVAAGNAGLDANSNGVVDLDSMDTPGVAKNCLTVGAAESDRPEFSSYTWGSSWPTNFPANPVYSDEISGAYDNTNQGMAAFSGRGPCDDGRIKPDIVAPGTDVISTRSKASTNVGWGVVSANTNYLYMGGTSMATPLTAGAAGLARQWVTTTGGITNPSAALLKAL